MQRPEICNCGHAIYLQEELDRALEYIERMAQAHGSIELDDILHGDATSFVEAHAEAKKWNEEHSVGTAVRVGKCCFDLAKARGDECPTFDSETASTAWVAGTLAVVKLEGFEGPCPLGVVEDRSDD